jgi:anthranilate phosphoribosyltransferase
MKQYIKKVLQGRDLSMNEAADAMETIMKGEATPAQIAGLIVGLKLKREKPEEVAGFVQTMRKHSLKISASDKNAVDGCGTGGDGKGSFNISTAAAIVAASAGVTVAKHGNRSVSSNCGSADILEAAGGNIDPGLETIELNLNDAGFCFMFAPRFHPAMKYAAAPRKELGVRTVFNILGPLTNPAGVKRQVIGVYDKTLMTLVADVAKLLGSEHVLVVHSRDGLDEFSVCAPSDYIELKDGKINPRTITPLEVGLKTHPAESLEGGNTLDNLKILNTVFDGDDNAYREAVLFNAGAMIYVGSKAETIWDGVSMARDAVDWGAAKKKLNEWVDVSKGKK